MERTTAKRDSDLDPEPVPPPVNGRSGATLARTGSLAAALQAEKDLNLALISVPGAYAGRETRKALQAGLHVMLFCDAVPLPEELALKRLAVSKGLLLMGPGCTAAVVNGKPLGFANTLRRGPVGVVADSGPGLQELTCLLDRYGIGVSQALGSGERDLKEAAAGGLSTLLALRALAADPQTKVLTLLSGAAAPESLANVTRLLDESGKPAVVCCLGALPQPEPGLLAYASNLEEAARLSAAFAAGASSAREARASLAEQPENASQPGQSAAHQSGRLATSAIAALAASEAGRLGPVQRFLRAIYVGGALADDALALAHGALGGVRSTRHSDRNWLLADPRRSQWHCILHLDDASLRAGGPHPMVDPAARTERLAKDGSDPETAVVLLDFILGHGAHPDPAGAALPAIQAARAAHAARGCWLPVVASVTGTHGDPQDLNGQEAKLRAAGVRVMPSNQQAAALAVAIATIAMKRGH